MRFAKKLALQAKSDSSRPYISHGVLKTVMEKFTKEIKNPTVACHAESMDQIFFQILASDHTHIFKHICETEEKLTKNFAIIQHLSMEYGILFSQAQIEKLADCVGIQHCEDKTVMCNYFSKMKIESEGEPLKKKIEQLILDFVLLIDDISKHLTYVEINVAGFRKLLKQREKQLVKFACSDHKCEPLKQFDWIKLVTPQLRLLLKTTDKMIQVFKVHSDVVNVSSYEIPNCPKLGPESYTCVQLQKDVNNGVEPILWMDVRLPTGQLGPTGSMHKNGVHKKENKQRQGQQQHHQHQQQFSHQHAIPG